MSPELHPKYRRCFKGAFRHDLVTAWEQELRAIVRFELASLAEPVTPELPSGVRLYATLDRIATRVLLLIVFGVRPDAELAMIGNAIYMVERGHHDLRDLSRWVLGYLGDVPQMPGRRNNTLVTRRVSRSRLNPIRARPSARSASPARRSA